MSKEYNISVIPGDGTGPEVVAEGIKVLETVASKFDFRLNFKEYNLGGEHFKATGEVLPDNMLEILSKSDAIYLGAIGHPDVKPGVLEKGILLKLRFYF
ncbi:MAG: isocitrate/isopropylmalate family dehydrogenase, partial [Desulfobacterales bacterium]